MSCFGGPMPGLKDPKGPRSLEGPKSKFPRICIDLTGCPIGGAGGGDKLSRTALVLHSRASFKSALRKHLHDNTSVSEHHETVPPPAFRSLRVCFPVCVYLCSHGSQAGALPTGGRGGQHPALEKNAGDDTPGNLYSSIYFSMP